VKSKTSGGCVVVVGAGTVVVVVVAGAVVVGASWVTGTGVETTGEAFPPPHEAIRESNAPTPRAKGFMTIMLQRAR